MAKARKTSPPRGARPAPEITEEREQKAWEMKVRGYTIYEIAASLKINASTVSRALDRIRKREYAEFAKTREQHKIDQTRQLEHIASQAMRSWEKSLKPHRKGRVTAAGREQSTVQESTEREGNTSYLYVVLKCMDDIRKIWGFDVLPATQDIGSSLAGVIRDLDDRAKRYEAELKGDGAAGDTEGTPAPAAP